MSWQITELPMQQPIKDCDYVGWLKHSSGLHVKVQIDYHATQEQALLIIQQFAGIITPAGLDSSLASTDSAGEK